MLRVVIDTNVLVAAAYADNSASRRIVDAALRKRLTVLISSDVEREYQLILDRAVRRLDYLDRLQQVVRDAERVAVTESPRMVAAIAPGEERPPLHWPWSAARPESGQREPGRSNWP